jgi:hypothetical protein
MNTTYYNSLSSNIKNAIVPNAIKNTAIKMDKGATLEEPAEAEHLLAQTQTPGWEGYYQFIVYYGEKTIGSRYVYALDYMDILEYEGIDYIDNDATKEMFYGPNYNEDETYVLWLRSVSQYGDSPIAVEDDGYVNNQYECDYQKEMRPAFVIDLSQIDYEEIDPSTVSASELGWS